MLNRSAREAIPWLLAMVLACAVAAVLLPDRPARSAAQHALSTEGVHGYDCRVTPPAPETPPGCARLEAHCEVHGRPGDQFTEWRWDCIPSSGP